jgi:hypothetical protein
MHFYKLILTGLNAHQIFVSAAAVKTNILPDDNPIFKLNEKGDAYLDVSQEALELRSKHFMEVAWKDMESFAESGAPNATLIKRQSCGAYHEFKNYANHGGYSNLGVQLVEAGPTGIRFHSSNRQESKMRYDDMVFTGSPKTTIVVWMRGVPDSGMSKLILGRNSYGCLREQYFGDNAVAGGDEIDIVEIYGNDKAEAVYYKDGVRYVDGHNYQISNPGYSMNMYLMYWEAGHVVSFQSPQKNPVYLYTNVPTNPMKFYFGAWDCSSFCGPYANNGAWGEIEAILYNQC